MADLSGVNTSGNTQRALLGGGDPGAFLTFNRAGAQNVASSVPSGVNQFNEALMGLLQKYQQLGTRPFAEQGLNAEEAQLRRVSQETPANLAGASPTIQSGARSAFAGALDPTISSARSSQQTFGEQIRSFGDVINSVRQFSQDYETSQQKLKEDARSNILLAVQLGGASGLDSIKKENPNIFKLAGLDETTLIESAKAKEKFDQESKKSFSSVDLGDRIGILDQQGNIVRTIAKGTTPGSSDKEIEKTQAKEDLLSLLNQYRTELESSTAVSRFLSPSKSAALNNLKGQITAVYKKQQQLGTLDAGVQKLIDTIIPGTGVSISQLSTQAQLGALDNFIINQGGTPGGIQTSTPATLGGGTVVMTGPQGTFNVPADKVELFKQNGYK